MRQRLALIAVEKNNVARFGLLFAQLQAQAHPFHLAFRLTSLQRVPGPPPAEVFSQGLTKTSAFPRGARSDFYELYWADLSAGSTWNQVEAWVMGLLFRNPKTAVPPNLWLAWAALWVISLIIIVMLLAASMLPVPASLLGVSLWSVWPVRLAQGDARLGAGCHGGRSRPQGHSRAPSLCSMSCTARTMSA